MANTPAVTSLTGTSGDLGAVLWHTHTAAQALELWRIDGDAGLSSDEAGRRLAECQAAGITVKMITGDHGVTAAAIGRELGLHSDDALTGEVIETMDDQTLRVAADNNVIARANPEHKMRLVAALQARGDYVAMTGDGVNDSPALKAADIGVAMGHRGTDAARGGWPSSPPSPV